VQRRPGPARDCSTNANHGGSRSHTHADQRKRCNDLAQLTLPETGTYSVEVYGLDNAVGGNRFVLGAIQ
jgi:hypothetical protein